MPPVLTLCCFIRQCAVCVGEEARALPPQGQGAAAGDTEAGVSLGGTGAAPTGTFLSEVPATTRGCHGGEIGAVSTGSSPERRKWASQLAGKVLSTEEEVAQEGMTGVEGGSMLKRVQSAFSGMGKPASRGS